MEIKDVKKEVKTSKENRMQFVNILGFIIVPLIVLAVLYFVMHGVMNVKH